MKSEVNLQLGYQTFFTGVVRGVGMADRSNRSKTSTWTEHYVFVEGHEFQTSKIKFSKKAISDSNIYDLCRNLVGKLVTFEVFANSRVYEGRIYTDHYYKGQNPPRLVREEGESSSGKVAPVQSAQSAAK